MAKILYFEDDNQHRELLGKILNMYGYDVDSYSDPTEFLTYLQKNENIPSYKLLITDVNMPNMDGITFVKDHINEVGENISVLFLTGGNSEEKIRKAGIKNFHFLEKPVDPTLLEEKVKKLMS